MKNMKDTIILGVIVIMICLVGTIYAAHENKANLEIEAPIEVAEPESPEAEVKVTTTLTAYTSAGFAVEVSIPTPPQRKVKHVPVEEMGEEKETSEDEVMVIEEEELVTETSVITPVHTYNNKDAEYDDLINSYSDWDGDTSWFELLGSKHITGYDACKSCCGKEVDDLNYGVTASTSHVKMGRTCAVNGLAFGTVIYIDGIGFRVVEDRGGMSNGNVDVYCDTHDQCYAITGTYDVYLVWSPDWV